MLGSQKLDELVNVFPGLLQPIPEIRVLVKDTLLSTKREVVLVLSLLEHRVWLLLVENGFEDDLGGCTSKVQNGKGGCLLGYPLVSGGRAADRVEEVVGGDPGEGTFVLPIQNGQVLV